MFGSVMLDVAIGLILTYLILSLVCTAMREVVELVLKDRSTFLHQGVCELLHDGDLTKDLYEHPLISSLYRDSYLNAKAAKGLPSYIPSRNFALAVLDMAARGRDASQALTAGAGAGVLSVATIRQNIAQLGNNKVQRVVLSALDLADGDINKVQVAIETWFNSSMDRVSGWYKKRSQWILVGLGIGISVLVNVDSTRLALSFYKDPGQRQAAIAMAGSMLKEPPPGTTAGGAQPTATDAAVVLARLDSLSLPIGWHDPHVDLMTLLGWLLTGLAISLGAPFWFDLLGKVMTVRSSLKPGSKASSDKTDMESAPPKTNVTIISPPAASPAGAAPAGTAAAALGPAVHPGDDYRPQEWASGHPQTGVL